MDGGAWWATVHGVAKSRTRLRNFTFQGLKPCASTEGDLGSIFGSGTKIPHAARCGQKSKKQTLQTTLLEAYWIHPSFVWASLVSQMVNHLSTMRETQVQSLGGEDLLEKGMAAHSSILAWKILWMEEPGRLQSMGSQRVRHDWVTSLKALSRYILKSN